MKPQTKHQQKAADSQNDRHEYYVEESGTGILTRIFATTPEAALTLWLLDPERDRLGAIRSGELRVRRVGAYRTGQHLTDLLDAAASQAVVDGTAETVSNLTSFLVAGGMEPQAAVHSVTDMLRRLAIGYPALAAADARQNARPSSATGRSITRALVE